MNFDDFQYRDQSHLPKRSGGIGCVHGRGSGVPPRSSPVLGATPCFRFRKTAGHQTAGSGVYPLPPPPDQAAQFPTHPSIQFFEYSIRHGAPVVVRPSPQQRIEVFLDEAFQVPSPPSTSELTHFVSKASHRFSRRLQAWASIHRHAVTEELPLPRSAHTAFGLVDHQF